MRLLTIVFTVFLATLLVSPVQGAIKVKGKNFKGEDYSSLYLKGSFGKLKDTGHEILTLSFSTSKVSAKFPSGDKLSLSYTQNKSNIKVTFGKSAIELFEESIPDWIEELIEEELGEHITDVKVKVKSTKTSMSLNSSGSKLTFKITVTFTASSKKAGESATGTWVLGGTLKRV